MLVSDHGHTCLRNEADRIITQAVVEGTSRNSSGDSIRWRDVFEGDHLVRVKDVTAIFLRDLLDVTGSKTKRQCRRGPFV